MGSGVFNLTTKTFDGFGDSLSTLSMTVNGTAGAWTNDSTILTPNSGGYEAAGHAFNCDGSITGYVTNGPAAIPEPSTLIVWSMLGGIGMTAGWWWRAEGRLGTAKNDGRRTDCQSVFQSLPRRPASISPRVFARAPSGGRGAARLAATAGQENCKVDCRAHKPEAQAKELPGVPSLALQACVENSHSAQLWAWFKPR